MTTLFNQPLNVINVGIAMFSDDLKKQHVPVTQLDWTPPGQGNMQVVEALDQLAEKPLAEKIAAANKIALERIIQSHPVLVGYDQAINVVPGMTRTTILHAGPPVAWENMCGAMKGAVTGALVFEGLATDLEDAARLAASGEITFSPCHEHDCVGSMAGVTSASMFMHIVENKTYGNRAFTNLSEQMAKILRMGANDQSVIDRLNWMRDVLGPMLRDAMNIIGEIDLRLMLAQALHMGDECHNRNNAGTTLLIQALTPGLIQAGYPVEQQREVFEFVASSDYFSGPTWMAMCKAALDAAHGIEYSTVVTTMARNGYEFGPARFRPAGAVVYRSGAAGDWPDVRRLQAGRLRTGYWRQRHHRNLRHRRLCDGDGTGHRCAGGRHGGGSHRLLAPDARNHPRREPERHHSAAVVYGHSNRHRHHQSGGQRHSAGDQHRHCP